MAYVFRMLPEQQQVIITSNTRVVLTTCLNLLRVLNTLPVGPFNPHNDPERYHRYCLLQMGKRGTERWSHLPLITQQVRTELGKWTWAGLSSQPLYCPATYASLCPRRKENTATHQGHPSVERMSALLEDLLNQMKRNASLKH